MKESKFKVGNVVNYLPKLSGLNPKTKFVVNSVYYKVEDELEMALTGTFTPTWIYGFVNSHLSATESQLKLFKYK
jgi:hypothetical protein